MTKGYTEAEGQPLNDGITRRQSLAVQGIAILLMLYHHFFLDIQMYGERLYFWNDEAVWRGAWFGKICVGLFAFISGYGMFYVLNRREEERFFFRLRQDYKVVLRQVLSVYRKYWLAFFLLPGIELLAGVRKFEPGEFFGNLSAVSSTYQPTWWYMGQYVKMLALLPLLELFFFAFSGREERKKKQIFFTVLLLAGVLLTAAGLAVCRPLWDFLLWLARSLRISFFLCFCVGFLAARFRIYQWLGRRQAAAGKAGTAATAALALAVTVGVRVKLSTYAAYAEFDFLLVPLFVYGALTLLAFAPPVEKIFVWFGRQSTYMWLFHGFFYAHIWERLTEYVHSGLLFYLILLALSAAAAYFLSRLSELLARKLLTIKNG